MFQRIASILFICCIFYVLDCEAGGWKSCGCSTHYQVPHSYVRRPPKIFRKPATCDDKLCECRDDLDSALRTASIWQQCANELNRCSATLGPPYAPKIPAGSRVAAVTKCYENLRNCLTHVNKPSGSDYGCNTGCHYSKKKGYY